MCPWAALIACKTHPVTPLDRTDAELQKTNEILHQPAKRLPEHENYRTTEFCFILCVQSGRDVLMRGRLSESPGWMDKIRARGRSSWFIIESSTKNFQILSGRPIGGLRRREQNESRIDETQKKNLMKCWKVEKMGRQQGLMRQNQKCWRRWGKKVRWC